MCRVYCSSATQSMVTPFRLAVTQEQPFRFPCIEFCRALTWSDVTESSQWPQLHAVIDIFMGILRQQQLRAERMTFRSLVLLSLSIRRSHMARTQIRYSLLILPTKATSIFQPNVDNFFESHYMYKGEQLNC